MRPGIGVVLEVRAPVVEAREREPVGGLRDGGRAVEEEVGVREDEDIREDLYVYVVSARRVRFEDRHVAVGPERGRRVHGAPERPPSRVACTPGGRGKG